MGNRWGSAALGVLVLALVVSGCTADAAPSETPTVSPSPTSSQTTSPAVDVPTPRLSATCDDLVPPAVVRAAVSDDVVAMPVALDARFNAPTTMATAQLGALVCVWANKNLPWIGEPDLSYREAVVEIVPDGAVPWARYKETYASGYEPSPYGADALGPQCVMASDYSSGGCYFQALIGTYWVDLRLEGTGAGVAESEAEMVAIARQFTDSLVEGLAAEGATPPAWTPPADPHETALSCSLMLSDAQAADLTGLSDLTVGPQWDGPRVSQQFYGMTATGSERCALLFVDTEASIGAVSYLPGGSWAYRQLALEWAAAGASTPLSLAGAGGGQDAIIRCADENASCAVDFLVDDLWVQVAVNPNYPGDIGIPAGVDLDAIRGNVESIADVVLANLNART